MKIELIFTISFVLLTLFSVNSVLADSGNPGCPSCVQIPTSEIETYKELFPIIIWTEQTVFDHNSEILVEGHIRPENTSHPVIITITNSIGNIVAIQQLTPNVDGSFSASFNTSGSLWKQDGEYYIKAQSGAESRIFKTNVSLISKDLGTKSLCQSNEILANADNGGVYCISYKATGEITGVDGFINTDTKTLAVDIRGHDVESIVIDLPRYILDSTANGEDTDFVVLLKGLPVTHEELASTNNDNRLLKIDIPADREGQIEIIGTSVVPEFGSIVLLMLVIGFVSVMMLSYKQNRFNIFTRF